MANVVKSVQPQSGQKIGPVPKDGMPNGFMLFQKQQEVAQAGITATEIQIAWDRLSASDRETFAAKSSSDDTTTAGDVGNDDTDGTMQHESSGAMDISPAPHMLQKRIDSQQQPTGESAPQSQSSTSGYFSFAASSSAAPTASAVPPDAAGAVIEVATITAELLASQPTSQSAISQPLQQLPASQRTDLDVLEGRDSQLHSLPSSTIPTQSAQLSQQLSQQGPNIGSTAAEHERTISVGTALIEEVDGADPTTTATIAEVAVAAAADEEVADMDSMREVGDDSNYTIITRTTTLNGGADIDDAPEVTLLGIAEVPEEE